MKTNTTDKFIAKLDKLDADFNKKVKALEDKMLKDRDALDKEFEVALKEEAKKEAEKAKKK